MPFPRPSLGPLPAATHARARPVVPVRTRAAARTLRCGGSAFALVVPARPRAPARTTDLHPRPSPYLNPIFPIS